ncbi:CBS domain-containing protein [Desulfatibacillum aliphaticivorans]|uniref:Polynucleotide adenylyltransferase region n=1 Tax=Desulfatibacillum aliphaticivorans TaxID=218208 RepID=B8FEB0_DESAL|nr:CBS domain-containing protein [Desulfatibacillum aliphaticivorans]ACL06891.1 Polynucleotide adenylyltransferase region [Desulfatibacillum aliphaticivorans]
MGKRKSVKNRENLTVITTHNNADYDAFASLLAAQKLYPNSVVVLPGTKESNLRHFFIQSIVYMMNLEQMSNIDINSVSTLVLVDTKKKSRIGRLAKAVGKPGVEIHVYDHHPSSNGDVQGDIEICRSTGATVTILTEILREKNIPITADEATLFCLGIHEDTGSFTFSSTTKEDFLAAAYLMEQGANLNIVSSLLAREYSPEQISVLNDLIRSSVFHPVHGIEVAVSTISLENYFADFAVLVHKLMKMENMDALIALGQMGDRIHVVGRSRLPEVNVGKVIKALGGGGHSFAAAATVKDRTLAQLEAEVLALLHKHVEPRQKARDVMSTPAISTTVDVSIKKAAALLTQYNINALLITDPPDEEGNKQLRGFISRQVVEKAMHHNLSEVPVLEYMTSDPMTVPKDADLQAIQKLVIENKQRILPVMDDGHIVGVITRTDLLNLLISRNHQHDGKESDVRSDSSRAYIRSASKMMRDRLSPGYLELVRELGKIADAMGLEAFLVGGFVRDLVMSHKNEDFDVVVEGDGIAFARRFAQVHGYRVHSHSEFGTAVIIMEDGFKIDVASARFEYYASPASLPVVETSSLKMDLYRRDFTVNTMAIQINEKSFGTLIDYFGAQRDIKAKAIRVLHNLSFVEDPTRVFRAIRFEQRYGFSIGKLTSNLIKNAVKMDFFRHLSGRRLFSELKLILEDENPIGAVDRMAGYNLLPFIHPDLDFGPEKQDLFESVKEVLTWHDLQFMDDSYMKWAVQFLALFHGFDQDQVDAALLRLEIAPKFHDLFYEHRQYGRQCLYRLEREDKMVNSELYRMLTLLPTEMLLFLLARAKSKKAKRRLTRFLTELKGVACLLSGKTLKQMGIKPGPIYKKVLDAVLDARLDGKVFTFEDEMALAVRLINDANA